MRFYVYEFMFVRSPSVWSACPPCLSNHRVHLRAHCFALPRGADVVGDLLHDLLLPSPPLARGFVHVAFIGGCTAAASCR